ncbi:MAG: hypothetical protein F9K16_13545 [Thermoanaerobaculia bacterium]|jgi:endonuclease/exonuclease/phosphatase (EEP) superfamily protein YafD|nr:MAG: hypothetical protein F9K16_13545 [Thermoanaerobaculia bacterium]MBZ0101778.1 endonuclease/exonuclease/phosphatase family protein [Thermoanaerobaculia bacterium]
MAVRAREAGWLGRVGPATTVLLGGWGVGQLARDWILPTAWLFYVPSLLWALALALVAVMRRWRGVPSLGAALAMLAPLAAGLLGEHRWGAVPAGAATRSGSRVTLVHWNISGGWRDAERQLATVRGLEPDLIVLSEANERAAGPYVSALDGFEVRSLGGLTIAARGAVSVEWLDRRREVQTVLARCRVDRTELSILAVNLTSALTVPRAPLLDQVLARIRERRPDLVVGDFNAPRRSRALSRLPAGWRHAYVEAGRGWSATWPQPAPMLAIDQLLVGPRLRVTGYQLLPGPGTDHRLQVAELEAPPAASR